MLWFEKLFTTTNKIQAEKLWESAKAAEWCCLHPDLHSFFRLRLQQSGTCFLQTLTILLAAVSVHLIPQLDLFRGSQTIGKLKLMSISTAEAHGQCAVHPPGFPVKTGVHIQPVIVEGRGNIGTKYCVRIEVYGDIEVQFPIALCDLIGEGYRIYRQPFGTCSEFRRGFTLHIQLCVVIVQRFPGPAEVVRFHLFSQKSPFFFSQGIGEKFLYHSILAM